MISSSTKSRHKRLREDWEKTREKERAFGRKYYYRIRDEIYELLGNKCRSCGEEDRRVLQIDHVYGGGNSRKIKNRSGQGEMVKKRNEIVSGQTKYQLLCANCNIIKKHENGEIKGHAQKTVSYL